jgi:uncharacterized membrane protein
MRAMAGDVPLTDAESPSERAFDYDRTVALSDGVFAIALTLLVLSITTPELGAGHHSLLGRRLLDRQDQFTSYAISFVIIGVLWVRHHRLFGALTRIDGRVTGLNLAYLAFVAFLPYPTRVLGLYGGQPAAVILYAATIGLLSLIAGLTRVHVQRAGLVSQEGARELALRESWVIVPVVFLASIPIAFVSTTLAQLCWLIMLVPTVRQRRAARRKQN